jgi:hypothetical protein
VTGRARVDGYYRVVHAESNDMLAITSSAVRRNRIPTRFVSFATSPTYPYLNGPLTATGRLQQYTSGAWRPYASAQVALAFQPSGDPNWYWVVKAYTTSTGAFTLRGKDYGTGYWAVYVEPDTRHFYSQTAARYITAR